MSFFVTLYRFVFSTPHIRNVCAALLWVLMITAPVGAMAAPPKSGADNETLITATSMNSDQATGVVTATGKVEIARAGYILHADKIYYYQKTGVMRAEGHVALLTPSGEVQFSDLEEITGDMKQAFAENIAILFPDNSRLVAKTAQRYEGRYLVADKAVYTACNCPADPAEPPLWQVRGKQIIQDNVEHDIYYHDATIDFFGVPAFYTPYFSAPDPSVKRRQGLLTVSPGYTPNLGELVRVPYYFDIAPNTDATLTTTFSTKDKAQLGGEFRHRLQNGNILLSGSFTNAQLINDQGVNEGDKWRGHIFGKAIYNIDNVWRAGTDIQLASDKSYLQRYNYSSATDLTNRLYVEGFKGRNYGVVNTYAFQDLRPGAQTVQPLVLPQASFSALGEPGKTWGGRWSVDGNMLVTSRDNSNQDINRQGPNTRRLYVGSGWQRQLISTTGLLTTISGLARVDTESADNVISPNATGKAYDNVFRAHQFEQANLTLRYPLARSGRGYQHLLEPIASITAAPAIHRDSKQPIEDSKDIQFDETNLFASNRFTGYDLIEGGSRAVYGLRNAITGNDGERIDIFGGESYSFTKNHSFTPNSGLQTRASDYVGRLELAPVDWITLNYGFRYDQKTLSSRRQDLLVSTGAPVFHPYFHYISGDVTDTNGIITTNEEGIIGFDSVFNKYWHLHAEHTQAFSPQPGPRKSSASISYVDECYILGVSLSHDDLDRADISSGTSIMFHMFLKNIGGVHTDSYTPTNGTYYMNQAQEDAMLNRPF
jgi:LPS-assembly protein